MAAFLPGRHYPLLGYQQGGKTTAARDAQQIVTEHERLFDRPFRDSSYEREDFVVSPLHHDSE
jgi:hypothetical protein